MAAVHECDAVATFCQVLITFIAAWGVPEYDGSTTCLRTPSCSLFSGNVTFCMLPFVSCKAIPETKRLLLKYVEISLNWMLWCISNFVLFFMYLSSIVLLSAMQTLPLGDNKVHLKVWKGWQSQPEMSPESSLSLCFSSERSDFLDQRLQAKWSGREGCGQPSEEVHQKTRGKRKRYTFHTKLLSHGAESDI